MEPLQIIEQLSLNGLDLNGIYVELSRGRIAVRGHNVDLLVLNNEFDVIQDNIGQVANKLLQRAGAEAEPKPYSFLDKTLEWRAKDSIQRSWPYEPPDMTFGHPHPSMTVDVHHSPLPQLKKMEGYDITNATLLQIQEECARNFQFAPSTDGTGHGVFHQQFPELHYIVAEKQSPAENITLVFYRPAQGHPVAEGRLFVNAVANGVFRVETRKVPTSKGRKLLFALNPHAVPSEPYEIGHYLEPTLASQEVRLSLGEDRFVFNTSTITVENEMKRALLEYLQSLRSGSPNPIAHEKFYSPNYPRLDNFEFSFTYKPDLKLSSVIITGAGRSAGAPFAMAVPFVYANKTAYKL